MGLLAVWVAFHAFAFLALPFLLGDGQLGFRFGPRLMMEWAVVLGLASFGIGAIWLSRRLRKGQQAALRGAWGYCGWAPLADSS
jgi:hypothetical protein